MSLEQSLAFLVFSLVAAITPGPSNVMLTATGGQVGMWRGMPCLLGVSAGMGTLIFAVAAGLGQIVLQNEMLLLAMKWCGAAFLLWLSWKIASAPLASGSSDDKAVGFTAAAAFQWINPKSWLVSASAAGTYLQAREDGVLLQAFLFAALFIVAQFPSGVIWLGFGASMQRLLRGERAARIFNIAMGLSLAASVLFILL